MWHVNANAIKNSEAFKHTLVVPSICANAGTSVNANAKAAKGNDPCEHECECECHRVKPRMLTFRQKSRAKETSRIRIPRVGKLSFTLGNDIAKGHLQFAESEYCLSSSLAGMGS